MFWGHVWRLCWPHLAVRKPARPEQTTRALRRCIMDWAQIKASSRVHSPLAHLLLRSNGSLDTGMLCRPRQSSQSWERLLGTDPGPLMNGNGRERVHTLVLHCHTTQPQLHDKAPRRAEQHCQALQSHPARNDTAAKTRACSSSP